MATCLVTGGAGFLGSHLSDELIARGNRVICVDNLETGSLANIEHIKTGDKFVHLNLDIIDSANGGEISEPTTPEPSTQEAAAEAPQSALEAPAATETPATPTEAPATPTEAPPTSTDETPRG